MTIWKDTAASFLGLSKQRRKSAAKRERIETVQMTLMVIGLLALFMMRLLSIGTVFGYLNFANPASVLYAESYILSQLGTLFIVAGHLVLRTKLTSGQMEKVANILMSVAIALYALCFITECVMMIKYRFGFDLSLKLALISRLWYFMGFAGTPFCFMLPNPKGRRKHKEGEFYYSEDTDEEVDLVT